MSSKSEYIFDMDIPNDRIDIGKKPDVSVKILKPRNDLELFVELEGLSIDNSIVNGIRRTILKFIPIYAFHRSNTFIDVKRSRHMYNNDLIYNQIETLPIFDVPNYFDLENPETFLSNAVMKNLFGKFLPKVHSDLSDENDNNAIDKDKKLLKIELAINVKNVTPSDKYVTTHDAVLKIDNKIVNSYQIRKPICILVLKPSEEIYLRADANLSISQIYASYEASTIAVHEELSPTKYRLWYETLEQLDKHVIFTKACQIIKKKLEYLKEYVKNTYVEERDKTEKIEIYLHGEDHTLGNMLATVLQKCEYVQKAGYNMPHLFANEVKISYLLFPKSKLGPIRVFTDSINYLIDVYDSIENKFNKK